MEHQVFNPEPLTLSWDWLFFFLLVLGLVILTLQGLVMAGLRAVSAKSWRTPAWTAIAIMLGVMVVVGWQSRIQSRLHSERVFMRRGFDVENLVPLQPPWSMPQHFDSSGELTWQQELAAQRPAAISDVEAPPTAEAAPAAPLRPEEPQNQTPLPAELPAEKRLLAEATGPTESHAESPPRAEPEISQQEKAKPDWVGMHPERIDNLYRTMASAGPYSTDEECYRHINREVGAVVCKYIDELLGIGDPYADSGPWASQQAVTSRLEQFNISPRYIRGHLWKDQYLEFVDSSVDRIAAGSSFGKMRTLHVLLEFDGRVQDDLRERWQKSQLTARLTLVGMAWASLLALLGIAFAYLRIDSATNGYYSGRLRLAAGLATILLAGMIVAVIRGS